MDEVETVKQPMTFFRKLLLFLGLPLYLLDQATKWWIVFRLPEPERGSHSSWEYIPVSEDWFHIVRVHNQGVAFGMGNGTAWAPVVFLVVPLVAMVLIRLFWKKGVFNNALSQIAVMLLLTGIFGNLTDRLTQGSQLSYLKDASLWERLSAGYVVDFISVRLSFYDKLVPSSGGWWPSFNVADSCICIAATLLFISGLREPKAK
jgi:signal peptidase II